MDEPKIIEWTEKAWNPTTGCDKVSSGCKNCYAESTAYWIKGMKKTDKYDNGFKLTLHENSLDEPMRYKKSQRIFLDSMSDVFHEGIPSEYIGRMFDIMNKCPQHSFIVLTKRADRMLELSPSLNWSENIWLGVTVEEGRYADRIGKLRKTDAMNKFVCAEPLLGDLGALDLTGIGWVVVGGESGKNARPIQEDWVKHLRDQCEEQNVPFTFKQWGGKNRDKNGSLLQGKYYHEMPV